MRIILHHKGRLTIDILGFAHPPTQPTEPEQAKSSKTPTSQISLDLAESPSVEESLFLGLLVLLRRHYRKSGGIPNRRIIGAVNAVLEELIERGEMPSNSPHDAVFLGKLLAILEQLTAKPTKLMIAELIKGTRKLIIDDDDEPDDDREDPGNGHPSNGEIGPGPDDPDDNGDSGGSNGTPSGSNGTPSGSNGTPGNHDLE